MLIEDVERARKATLTAMEEVQSVNAKLTIMKQNLAEVEAQMVQAQLDFHLAIALHEKLQTKHTIENARVLTR